MLTKYSSYARSFTENIKQHWMLFKATWRPQITHFFYLAPYDYIPLLSLDFKLQNKNRCAYPKVRGCKSVRSGGSSCSGGGGVGEVGIDISKKVAHHCWHTGTHVFGRQTGEMPAEDNKHLA